MRGLNPNGDFRITEELQTTAVFPKAYTIEQAALELREQKACGQFIVYVVNGGIRKMEFLERVEVEVNTP